LAGKSARPSEGAAANLPGIAADRLAYLARQVGIALHEPRRALEQAEHILGNQHLAVAVGEAPMPMIGTGTASVTVSAMPLHHALDHDAEGAGFGHCLGVGQILLRFVRALAARAVAAEHIDRLWSQADMADAPGCRDG
jgi:hypothetical protein